VLARRAADLRALLGTLFGSTGTIMLTAGDEFGRTQQGNNNAYAQDNAIGWVDWAGRDRALEDWVASLAAWRAARADWFTRFPRTESGHRSMAGRWMRRCGKPRNGGLPLCLARSGPAFRADDRPGRAAGPACRCPPADNQG
jgi:glycogen operon protein